jgi:ABC-type multidrug transport system fused ATPase/permease subunit
MVKFLNELKIYIVLFILLSSLMHFKAWLDMPIEHIKALPSSSLGVWHPFVLTFGIYALISVIRFIINIIKKIIKKEEKLK